MEYGPESVWRPARDQASSPSVRRSAVALARTASTTARAGASGREW